ncbi:lipopolysaccharide biosynthesis protein [Terrimicrobium sacchariphilum]|uniref:Lipopolysaccharide biosynthesis protein n=1 Tax=Terrimicrobium sacchariphilum TaxID=690879 RepID=A0A146G6Y2_TERSA|nr:glycosyltransferase [Terrimicrobium sacchariphilum]GAT32667.1 lipopolysaccharide biosynthesis protein [Terrimicrobium sacchariphilum]
MICLAYCADRLMCPSLHVSLFSVLSHATDEVRLWLYLEGYSPKEIDRLKRTVLSARPDTVVNFIQLELGVFKAFRPFYGSYLPYARLLLPEIIPAERFIYLDADTLCTADCRFLMGEELGDAIAGMRAEGPVSSARDRDVLLAAGMTEDAQTFNSGVIVLDAKKWREEGIGERILDFGRNNSAYLFTADQVCLNAVLKDRIAPLAYSWNECVYPIGSRERKAGPEQQERSAIYHFLGNPKPWDIGAFLFSPGWPLFSEYVSRSRTWDEVARHHIRRDSVERAWRLRRNYTAAWKGSLSKKTS